MKIRSHNQFSLEVWPGAVRIHQGCDLEESNQVIELSCEQISYFAKALLDACDDAVLIGLEFDAVESAARALKATKKGD